MRFNKLFSCILFFWFTQSGNAQNSVKLIERNTNVKTKENVEFLSVKKGSLAILDETYEPYFSVLQFREIHALTGFSPPSTNIKEARNFAREKFSSAVTSFTNKEKSAIKFVTSVIKETLLTNDLSLIADHPWKFIKIEDWLCGGFAHTRGDYIILSQRHLSKLTSTWSDNMSKSDSTILIEKLGSLLVHEQFHSLQRKYPKKFENLYVDAWNFEKVTVEIDSTVLVNQLTNPDAPKAEWAVYVDGEIYWIRTLINPDVTLPRMGVDFIDVVFALEKKDQNYILKNSLNQQKLSDFTSYSNSFPVKKGLDHPNEISAYMFSKYYAALINGEIPFEKVSGNAQNYSKKYLSWLIDSFKNQIRNI